MLGFWYSKSPQFAKDHKDFWRARLIAHFLLFLTAYFFILTVLNVFYFEQLDLALIDCLGLVISLTIYFWFYKSGNVNVTAWAVTLMASSLAILFIISVGGNPFSILWATLIPPFAFFLIGRKRGSIISAIAFSICAYLIYTQQQQTITIGLGSLFNTIEVSIAHILIFRFYEKTRSLAYQNLSNLNDEIKKLAETDKLTELYNRQKFDAELSALITKSEHSQASHCLLMCDIDYFKKINDTHGHLVGDKVLKEFAHLLQQKIGEQALIARWGGEEFVIILLNTALLDAAKQANELRSLISSNTVANMPITISLGVTAIQKSNDSVLKVLERADKALYFAKHHGRNLVCINDNNAHVTCYDTFLKLVDDDINE